VLRLKKQKNAKQTMKSETKKATHEVALGWLYDGSLSDVCGLLYRFWSR